MGPEFREIGDINITISEDEEFSEGKLSFSQHPQPTGKSFTRIAISDSCCGQAMKPGLAKCFQFTHPFHHQGKEW